MRIMTFNTQHCLNYITKRIDFETMASAIIKCDPDVVGLNEMRGEGPSEDYQAQVEKLAALTGMKYFYFSRAISLKEGPYGNGILSKVPILNVKTIPIPDPTEKKYERHYETRCILKAELDGGVNVLVTHMGLNPDEQENAVRTVIEHVEPEKCILMGDFNMTPDNEILSPIFELMTDTAEKHCNDKLSFPSDVPNRKIDYIFTSRDVNVISADIPEIIASDHRPHIADVKC